MKKEIGISILLVILFSAFAVITFLVFLTNGNAALIRTKLKLGAKLLMLSAILNLNSCDDGNVVACYLPALPENTISFNTPMTGNKTFSMNLKQNNVLSGIITNRKDSVYSFHIESKDRMIMQKSEIYPKDGKYDSYSEEFRITIDSSLKAGDYSLLFYNVSNEQQKSNAAIENFALKIVE